MLNLRTKKKDSQGKIHLFRKKCAINDPLGRPHPQSHQKPSLFSLENCFVWRDFEKCRRTDVQTPPLKIVITTGRDVDLAEWIKNRIFENLRSTADGVRKKIEMKKIRKENIESQDFQHKPLN